MVKRTGKYQTVGPHSRLPVIGGVAVLISVVVVLVTALNDCTKEKQLRGLQAKIETEHKSPTIRAGNSIQLIVNELVLDDVTQIKYGDLLPTDGLLIQSNDLNIENRTVRSVVEEERKAAKREASGIIDIVPS
uniref:Cation_ATPase_N domain-containing protein n=1 Tax=Rhabditophanes sp. KR3021 TaxID=114890 RepID=A0AC35TRW2_9BILA